MKKSKYIKIWNAEEILYFHEEDLKKEDERYFINAGYKIEAVFALILSSTYKKSIKKLKCIND